MDQGVGPQVERQTGVRNGRILVELERTGDPAEEVEDAVPDLPPHLLEENVRRTRLQRQQGFRESEPFAGREIEGLAVLLPRQDSARDQLFAEKLRFDV